MTRLKCLVYLILIWTAGCYGYSQKPSVNRTLPPSPEFIPSLSVRETPQSKKQTSIPVVEYTETPSPTLTPTAIESETDLELIPIDIQSNIPEGGALSGVLAIYELSRDSSNRQNYLQDLPRGLKKYLDPDLGRDLLCGPVSPNRDRLVCEAKNRLLILDNTGRVLTSDTWKSNWLLILGWLDNDQIMLMKTEAPLASTIIYNPFNHKEIVIAPNYPNISDLGPFNNYGDFSATGTFYSPTLEFVVYESLDYTNVVWDRTNKNAIAEIPLETYNPYPRWSPDGQQVVLAGKGGCPQSSPGNATCGTELYLVNSTGESRQITEINTIFPNALLFDMSWSPDGRLIAFQLDSKDERCSSRCIMILDPVTLALKGFQIPSEDFSNESEFPVYTLTWSPVSRQLLLSLSERGNSDQTFLIILDIYSHDAFQVAQNARILGWMNSNP